MRMRICVYVMLAGNVRAHRVSRPGAGDRLSSPGLMRLRHYTSSLNLESGAGAR